MRFARAVFKIGSKLSESNNKNNSKIVCSYADKMSGVALTFGTNDRGEYLCQIEVRGYSSAYCKGVIAEIKELIKTTYRCKVDTLFYAY